MHISVQSEDFAVDALTRDLIGARRDIGAVVSFTGRVRDRSEAQNLLALELEHYPAMTEKALTDIAEQARERWQIDDLAIVHRVGRLAVGDNIVAVVVISAHRRDAFEACEFLMDYLKTRAPFWKKEITTDGEAWVEARSSDDAAADRWKQ
jgi:molybdopterin synthase catalytic subunit